MIRKNGRLLRLLALMLALVMFAVACGGDDDDDDAAGGTPPAGEQPAGEDGDKPKTPAGPAPTAPDTAERLREVFQAEFQEHVFTAAMAANAALGGRTDQFKAAADGLNSNAVDLQVEFERTFGIQVGEAFTPLWKKHIGFIVNYVEGLKANDQAKKDKAIADLTAYTADFGAFVNSALPELPKEAVAELVKTHILTLKDSIDAMAAKDYVKAYTALRPASQHTFLMAEPLAAAIVAKFPQRMTGNTKSAPITLYTEFDNLLQESVFLLAAASDAIFGKRADEMAGIQAALDVNSNLLKEQLNKAVGGTAGATFDPVWKKHIGFFIDLATGVATGDKAKTDKANADLGADTLEFGPWPKEFGATVNSIVAAIDANAMSEQARSHVLTLDSVYDNQSVKGWARAIGSLRQAAPQMQTMAKVMADGIAKQFPAKYPA